MGRRHVTYAVGPCFHALLRKQANLACVLPHPRQAMFRLQACRFPFHVLFHLTLARVRSLRHLFYSTDHADRSMGSGPHVSKQHMPVRKISSTTAPATDHVLCQQISCSGTAARAAGGRWRQPSWGGKPRGVLAKHAGQRSSCHLSVYRCTQALHPAWPAVSGKQPPGCIAEDNNCCYRLQMSSWDEPRGAVIPPWHVELRRHRWQRRPQQAAAPADRSLQRDAS